MSACDVYYGDLLIFGDYQDNSIVSIKGKTVLDHVSRFLTGYDDPCGGYVYAVKRDGPNAGKLVWSIKLDKGDWDQITMSPIVYNDTVFVGLSAQELIYGRLVDFPCCKFRGKFVALDVHTGNKKWEKYMTIDNYGALDQFSGASVWGGGGAPTIDEARNLVYVPTGNNYWVPEAYQACIRAARAPGGGGLLQEAVCSAPYSENYFDSIVALRIDTGIVEWVMRSQNYDAWTMACNFEVLSPTLTNSSSEKYCANPVGPDADFAQPPMLYTLMKNGQPVLENGEPKQLLGAATKGGEVFILDPDANSDASRIVARTRVGPGSSLGGMEFGSSTDGERIYVSNTNFEHESYTLVAGSPGHENETINGGFWAAVDAATGDILWETPVPAASEPLTGTLPYHLLYGGGRGKGYYAKPFGGSTVANGVVFAGVTDWDGTMVALNAETGEILWQFLTGYGIAGSPTIVDGRLYWGAGYKYAKSGQSLYSFGLPGDNR